MNRKLLLLAGNYYPEPTGIGLYNGEMIDWLADNGFDCTVISTYPYYPYWQVQAPYKSKNNGIKKEIKVTAGNNEIIVYRCPHYTPAKPTGAKRMLFDFSFFMSSMLKLIGLAGKRFDFVMTVAPPLPLGIAAALYKTFSGATFLYHIQDLQVDAAKELNMITSKKLLGLLFKIEKFILKKADKISTISKGIEKKVQLKTDKKIYLLPNWTNTENIFPVEDSYALKKLFGFNADVPLILYSGAIGEKQGLENVLQVAAQFQEEDKVIQFVICGTGPYKLQLEEKAAAMQLKNICFMPLQTNEKLNTFLNIADVHLVVQKAGVGNLVMPSKLSNICSVGGLAVATAEKDSALYNVIVKNNIGLVCPPEDVAALKTIIEKAIVCDCGLLRNNARNYAEKYLSIDKIMRRYVAEVLETPVEYAALQLSIAK